MNLEKIPSWVVAASGKKDLVNTPLNSQTTKTLKFITGASSHILCIDVDDPTCVNNEKLLSLVSPHDCFVVSSQYTLDDVLNQRCRYKLLYKYNSEKELSNPRTKKDESGNTIPQPIEIFYNNSKKVAVIGKRDDGYEYKMYGGLTDIHFDLQDIVDYKINFKLTGKNQGNSDIIEKHQQEELTRNIELPEDAEDVDVQEFSNLILRLLNKQAKIVKKNRKLLTFPCLFPELHTHKNNAYAFKKNGYYVCRCQGLVCEGEYKHLNDMIREDYQSTLVWNYKGFDIHSDKKIVVYQAPTGSGKTEMIAEECIKAVQNNSKLLVVLQSKEAIDRLKGRINYKSNGAMPAFEMSGRMFTWISENNNANLNDDFNKANVILTHHYYLSTAGDVLTYYPSLLLAIYQENIQLIVDEAHTWLELASQLTMEVGGLYNHITTNRYIENKEQLTRDQWRDKQDKLEEITSCLEPTFTDFGTIELRKQYKVYSTLEYIDLVKEIENRFSPIKDYKVDEATEYKLYKNPNPTEMIPNNLEDCNECVDLLLNPSEYVLVSRILGDDTPRKTIGRTMATFYQYQLIKMIFKHVSSVILTTATLTNYHYNILDSVVGKNKYEIIRITDPIKSVKQVVVLHKTKDTQKQIRKQILENMNDTNARALVFMPTIDNAKDVVTKYSNMICCDNGWYTIAKRVSQDDYVDNFKRNVIVCGLESSVSKGYNFREEVDENAEGFDIVYFDSEPVSPDILKKYVDEDDKIIDYYDTYAMTTFTQAIGRALRKEKEQLTICLNNIGPSLVEAIVRYLQDTLDTRVIVDTLSLTNLKISTIKDIKDSANDLSENYLYQKLYMNKEK